MAIGEHEQVLAERLKAALDTLEAIARDRTLLQELTIEERTRLLTAAGAVFDPDVVARRRAAKELRRRKKNDKLAVRYRLWLQVGEMKGDEIDFANARPGTGGSISTSSASPRARRPRRMRRERWDVTSARS